MGQKQGKCRRSLKNLKSESWNMWLTYGFEVRNGNFRKDIWLSILLILLPKYDTISGGVRCWFATLFRLLRSFLKSRLDPQEACSEWNKSRKNREFFIFKKLTNRQLHHKTSQGGWGFDKGFGVNFHQTKKKKIEGIARGKLLYRGSK